MWYMYIVTKLYKRYRLYMSPKDLLLATDTHLIGKAWDVKWCKDDGNRQVGSGRLSRVDNQRDLACAWWAGCVD